MRLQEETVWAIQRLREYIVKGFAMDDERLKTIKMGRYRARAGTGACPYGFLI